MMGPNNSVCMLCISWSSPWSCNDDEPKKAHRNKHAVGRSKLLNISMFCIQHNRRGPSLFVNACKLTCLILFQRVAMDSDG